jgi:transposase
MSKEAPEVLARRRAETIVRVQGGTLTVKEAAAQLGVSRKTYYQWERRALQGMMQALQDKESGRPSKQPDEQTQAMQRRLAELEERERIRQQVERIRTVVDEAKTSAEKK